MKWLARRRGAALFLASFATINALAAWKGSAWHEAALANLLVDERPWLPPEAARYDLSASEALERYWPHIPDARVVRLSFIVGMSQLYRINQAGVADKTVGEYLDDALSRRGARIYGLVAPNMSTEEALLFLLATTGEARTRPHAFVYAVCFDKLRNLDIRPSLQRFVRARPELEAHLNDVMRRYADTYPRAAGKLRADLDALRGADTGSSEPRWEERVRDTFAAFLPVVAQRSAISGRIASELYTLRNRTLGIRSSTKRPIVGARYELNQELLQMLMDEATRRGVALLPYVIPLNPTAGSPYVAAEYAAFRAWFASETQRRGISYLDLTDLVPADEWGTRAGEPDFKHFTGAGHRRTAQALLQRFGAALVGPASQTP